MAWESLSIVSAGEHNGNEVSPAEVALTRADVSQLYLFTAALIDVQNIEIHTLVGDSAFPCQKRI